MKNGSRREKKKSVKTNERKLNELTCEKQTFPARLFERDKSGRGGSVVVGGRGLSGLLITRGEKV